MHGASHERLCLPAPSATHMLFTFVAIARTCFARIMPEATSTTGSNRKPVSPFRAISGCRGDSLACCPLAADQVPGCCPLLANIWGFLRNERLPCGNLPSPCVFVASTTY